MFPEYRDLITRLKAETRTFARLFDEHNELDQRVKNIEARIIPGTDSEVEQAGERPVLRLQAGDVRPVRCRRVHADAGTPRRQRPVGP